MGHRIGKFTAVASIITLAMAPAVVGAGNRVAAPPVFTPGSPGIGDPYFPLDGNGGYDTQHYALDMTYDPATDVLSGDAVVTAVATQNLSRFNLDFVGLDVRWIKVNGVAAKFARNGGELTVIPRRGLPKRQQFTVEVVYDGIPQPVSDQFGLSGFLATDDGALVVGQPHVASTWFPVNDHPSDPATYSFAITVPAGLEAIANGRLLGSRTANGWSTWRWRNDQPMASYLATMTVGDFDLRSYQSQGIRFWDAVDPDLFDPIVAPHTGDQMLLSQQASPSFKRLVRTISVPATGEHTLSFWTIRDTEPAWDHFFVEAHTPGNDDWTTLPEVSGITSADTGSSCPSWLSLHPFLAHYETETADGCDPTGTTGAWNAVSGASDGYEQWTIDLSAYAGTDVEVSLSYASDDSVQGNGVVVDDIDVPGTAGDTSFENDGDTLDGWVVTGAPDGSAPNENDWIAGTVADAPPPVGTTVDLSLGRQPEILQFLQQYFGRYPYSAAGAIVDDYRGLGFALENATRPIYAREFFGNTIDGDNVVVHENAHQWFGDALPLGTWSDIWLNEGFATYAEWLWSENEGLGTVQEIFDYYTSVIAPGDDFWTLPPADPGPDAIFDQPVYLRGAMTLQALRLQVGDHDFFTILRTWGQQRPGTAVSTAQFVRLAERISGQQLDDLFDAWLYQPVEPPLPVSPLARTAAATSVSVPAVARSASHRQGARLERVNQFADATGG